MTTFQEQLEEAIRTSTLAQVLAGERELVRSLAPNHYCRADRGECWTCKVTQKAALAVAKMFNQHVESATRRMLAAELRSDTMAALFDGMSKPVALRRIGHVWEARCFVCTWSLTYAEYLPAAELPLAIKEHDAEHGWPE